MKIVATSDTHNKRLQNVPVGDVLIHAGDATNMGTDAEVSKFADWFGALPHPVKLFVPGNHDWLFQTDVLAAVGIMKNRGIDTLIDTSIIHEGVKFYGSPWQPEFCDWAFNLPRGSQLEDRWAFIPDDTDVLITHGPPMNILDTVGNRGALGCEDLRARIQQLSQLKLHLFGHIHDSYGSIMLGTRMTFANVAHCDEAYRGHNPPFVYEL